MNPHVARKIQELQEGRTIISKEKGNSMLPLIRSGQPVLIHPVLTPEQADRLQAKEHIQPEDLAVGDIVLAKVHGNVYTHLISGIRGVPGELEWQISNNRGHVNGWTRNVYGKIVQILP